MLAPLITSNGGVICLAWAEPCVALHGVDLYLPQGRYWMHFAENKDNTLLRTQHEYSTEGFLRISLIQTRHQINHTTITLAKDQQILCHYEFLKISCRA